MRRTPTNERSSARRAAAAVGAAAVALLALAADRRPEAPGPLAAGAGTAAERPSPPATGEGGEAAGPAATVTMTNQLTFAPDTVTIRPGESVEFENTSALVHTVTADPDQATLDASVRLPDGAEPFDSGRMEPGETFTHTFETPGTYRYFCVPHEAARMRATVIVEPADEAHARTAGRRSGSGGPATGPSPR